MLYNWIMMLNQFKTSIKNPTLDFRHQYLTFPVYLWIPKILLTPVFCFKFYSLRVLRSRVFFHLKIAFTRKYQLLSESAFFPFLFFYFLCFSKQPIVCQPLIALVRLIYYVTFYNHFSALCLALLLLHENLYIIPKATLTLAISGTISVKVK